MKTILAFAAVVSLAIGVFADIQDPPGNDFGPTRKLGRGISNLIIAPTEFFTTVNQINQTEGNSAGAGYGVWKGAGRTAARQVAGLVEILTFPVSNLARQLSTLAALRHSLHPWRICGIPARSR